MQVSVNQSVNVQIAYLTGKRRHRLDDMAYAEKNKKQANGKSYQMGSSSTRKL